MSKRKAEILSLYQIMEQYPTDEATIRYLESLAWSDKPVCSKCGCDNKITEQKKAGDYWCGSCRSYFNVFTNTPLERNKVDARKWVYASYTLLTSRKGISSLQLSKEIGVQQRTAWYMLHRLRVICGGDMQALHGQVETDETYIGGKEKNRHPNKKKRAGRGGAGKTAILGMRERKGRVKAMPVENTTKETLQTAVHKNVRKGSTLFTDENPSYNGVANRHYAVNHSAKEYVNGMAHTNGIESVWAVLKRGFSGVYHNWSKKHCRAYVNEFSFRLNDGNCEIDTQDRLNSLFAGMHGKQITYKELTG